MIKVDSNIDDVLSQLEDISEGLDSEMDILADKILDDALIDIKSHWPIASGDSLRGWAHRKESENHWVIFNVEDYTEFVRDGLAEELATNAVEEAISNHINDDIIGDA